MAGAAHQLTDAVDKLERGVFDAQRREKAAAEELRAREVLIDAAQRRMSDVQARVSALERELEETKRAQRSCRALVAQLDAQARKRWLEADEGLLALGAEVHAPGFLATKAPVAASSGRTTLDLACVLLRVLYGPSSVAK